jgi:hypothetical protein
MFGFKLLCIAGSVFSIYDPAVLFQPLVTETKKDQFRWQSVLTSLDQLRPVAPVPIMAGSTTR